ncbi:DUF3558 domain-containing protein [Nocardia sp. N2S4-5]|uniref:DUF3558 domain-containing protein n=1 Tax=Nocardia sp. N2S4-5 TaxID=3351565 RepID=UPI0037D30240
MKCGTSSARNVIFLLSITVLMVAGCSNSNDETEPGNESTSQRPSMAATVSSAPAQDSGGRTDVSFDPCVEIADATVERAGFDPATRRRADQVHTGYAFIGCDFERKEFVRGQSLGVGSLTISSVNLGLDDFRKREGSNAQEIKINGRAAVTYQKPQGEACFVVMTGPDGVIDLMVDSTSALTQWRACDHAQEIAEIIESTIPKY